MHFLAEVRFPRHQGHGDLSGGCPCIPCAGARQGPRGLPPAPFPPRQTPQKAPELDSKRPGLGAVQRDQARAGKPHKRKSYSSITGRRHATCIPPKGSLTTALVNDASLQPRATWRTPPTCSQTHLHIPTPHPLRGGPTRPGVPPDLPVQ